MPRAYGVTNAAPYASAPAVGAAGDTYYNTTSKTLYLSDGTSWNVVSGGGASPSLSYWASRLVGNTAISTSTEGIVPVSAATMASGFTISGSGVQCNVAGKYIATALVAFNFAGSGNVALWIAIQQFRGATQIINWDYVDGAQPANVSYNQGIATGEFDLQVGDTLFVAAQSPVAGTTTLSQSSFFIAPMGGPVGPQGPDVTLVQSNYWFGAWASPAGILGNDVTSIIGWTTVRANGFTLASSGQRITPSLAGKYLITANLGYQNGGTAASFVRIVFNQYDSGGGLKQQNSIVGNGIAANNYGDAIGTVEFDMVVGDYIVITGAAPGGTASYISNSYCTVIPVGGTKGDPGAQGSSGGPVPTGGAANQIIVKQSATDMDVAWQDQPGVVAYKYGILNGYVVPASATQIYSLGSVHLTAGRLYKTTVFLRAINNGTSSIRFQFGVAPSGWTLDAYTVGAGAYGSATLLALGTVSVTGTYSITINATSTPSGAQIWTDLGGFFMVEDIGANRGQQ
jgi:hypothetical protein